MLRWKRFESLGVKIYFWKFGKNIWAVNWQLKLKWGLFFNFWIKEIHFGPIKGCHVANPYQPNFFKLVAWPIRGNQPHTTHSATPSPISLSLSPFLSLSFSLSSQSRAFHWSFHCRPFTRDVHAPHVEEAQPPTNTHLDFGRRRAAVQLPLATKGSASHHYFWQILASSSHISRLDHLFCNELSTLYKTIPILMDDSSSLKSGSLFTPCIPQLFLMN